MPKRRLERLRSARAAAWVGGALSALSCFSPAIKVWAADAGAGQRQVVIEPSLSLTQTLSDNPELRAVDVQSDSITRLTLGLGLRANGGPVRGRLDYALSSLVQARNSARNAWQNQLSAALETDFLDKRAQLEASASIGRSAISAFGAQPDGSANTGANTTEQRSLRLVPSLRGPLGPNLRYTATASLQANDAKDNTVGDSSTAALSLHVEPVRLGRLSWSVDASHTTSDFKAGRSTDGDRVFASLQARLEELDLRLNANAGVELSNLASADRRRYSTWGLGAEWVPSARTRVAADYGERFFGRSHNVTVEHRTPLTVWRFTDSRSLSLGGGGGTLRGTAYDLYFAQFASAEPDPVKRADLVNGFLRLNGIDPQASLNLDFLRSAPTLQDRQELSVAWRGMRSTAMLSFTRSGTHRLDDGGPVAGDLAASSTVDLRGVAVNLTHRLTPQSVLDLSVSQQQGRGQLASQDSWQRQYTVQYTLRPAIKSNLIVGLRHGQYERPGLSYTENAVYATYGIRF